MKRLTCMSAVLALLALSAASVSADPIIVVGDHDLLPNTPGQTISISVSGGDLVQGLDFYVQIGDGGAVNGGTDTRPIITAVDIVGLGTLFNASNTGQTTATSTDLLWACSTTTDTNVADNIAATGVLAFLTIDTTGMSVGESEPLLLAGVAEGVFGAPGVDTGFAGVSADITNGSINAVPEPATTGLLALAALAGAWWRRKRRTG